MGKSRAHKGLLVLSAISVVAVFLISLLSAAPVLAVDPPHDTLTSCRNCHDKLVLNWPTGGVIDNTPVNQVCRDCHSTTGSVPQKAKLTHSSVTTDSVDSYGLWATDCIDCHSPHSQKQLWAYPGVYDGSPASGVYLETGTVSSLAANVVTVAFTNGTWPDNYWKGYTLRPNINDYFAYKVTGSTGTTLSSDRNFDTYAVRPGVTFGLAYGKLIRAEVRTGRQVVNSSGTVYNTNVWRQVKFFNTSGVYSPGWSLGAQNAICVVCHLKTEAFNIGYAQAGQGFDNVTSDYYNTWHKGNLSNAATNCWSNTGSCHKLPKEGFDANCTGCHGQPPVDPTTVVKMTVVNDPWYSGKSAGAHQVHVDKGKDLCALCHEGGGTADAQHKFADRIEMGFANVVGSGATFNDGIAFANASWSVVPGNGSTTITTTGGVRTCSGIYCHSDGSSLTAAAPALVDWDTGGPLNCGSCHASPMIADAHDKHAVGGANNYQFDCFECHSDTLNQGDNSTVPPAKQDSHVNLLKDVAWGNIASGSAAYNGSTCETVYCHSDGAGGAPNNTPVWNDLASVPADCTGCHGSNAAATNTIASGRHPSHIDNTVVVGKNLGCNTCHAGTVGAASDTTVTSAVYHVNGVKNVVFNGLNPLGAFTQGADTCSTLYCHSDGADNVSYWSVAWSDAPFANDCAGCHGKVGGSVYGEPSYVNAGAGVANANSHSAHVGAATDCARCHADTTVSGTSVLVNGIHLDGVKNVAIASAFDSNGGTKYDNYNVATKTCSSIACHGSGTPQWGGTVACESCHSVNGPDVDDYAYSGGTGTAAVINSNDWSANGHGQGIANLPLGCTECHDSGVSHGAAANPFRLKDATALGIAAIDGWNTLCYLCHESGATAPLAASIGNRVDKYHYGTDHSTTDNGGRFCWDCHDPHGDGNIKMIHQRAQMKTDGTYGTPGSLANLTGTDATPTTWIEFTDNTKATGVGGFAINTTDNGGGTSYSKGVCNACHEAAVMTNDHYTNTVSDDHNQGTLCTDCHKHSKDTTVDGNAFKGEGPCLLCHASTVGTSPVRRAVTTDFTRTNRHVKNASVTNLDCVVCHLEGDTASSEADPSTDALMHGGDGGDKTVNLRDVDTNGQAVAWNSATAGAAMRDGMDTFCMNCHDSDTSSATAGRGGAYNIAVDSAGTGMLTSAGNARRNTPFNPSDGGSPTDIRGLFNYTNAAGKLWAAHHNLNQFTKRYSSTYQTTYSTAGGWTANTTKDSASMAWDVGMHCSDCHVNESNAHGGNWNYMLMDMSGIDNATVSSDGTGAGTFVCYYCHDRAIYNDDATNDDTGGPLGTGKSRLEHGDMESGYPWDNTQSRNADNVIICLNCHGGGMARNGIHGTNASVTTFSSNATKAYRFTHGKTLYIDITEAGWEDTTQPACYTKSGQWGSTCNKHDGGTSTGRIKAPKYSRALE